MLITFDTKEFGMPEENIDNLREETIKNIIKNKFGLHFEPVLADQIRANCDIFSIKELLFLLRKCHKYDTHDERTEKLLTIIENEIEKRAV